MSSADEMLSRARAALKVQDFAGAKQMFARGMDLLEREHVNMPELVAHACINVGVRVHEEARDFHAAVDYHLRAGAHARGSQDVELQLCWRRGLASAYLALGETRSALTPIREALELIRSTPSQARQQHEMFFVDAETESLVAAGLHQEALACLERHEAQTTRPCVATICLAQRAVIYAHRGSVERAAAQFRAAVASTASCDAPSAEAYVRETYGQFLTERGDHLAALSQIEAAERLWPPDDRRSRLALLLHMKAGVIACLRGDSDALAIELEALHLARVHGPRELVEVAQRHVEFYAARCSAPGGSRPPVQGQPAERYVPLHEQLVASLSDTSSLIHIALWQATSDVSAPDSEQLESLLLTFRQNLQRKLSFETASILPTMAKLLFGSAEATIERIRRNAQDDESAGNSRAGMLARLLSAFLYLARSDMSRALHAFAEVAKAAELLDDVWIVVISSYYRARLLDGLHELDEASLAAETMMSSAQRLCLAAAVKSGDRVVLRDEMSGFLEEALRCYHRADKPGKLFELMEQFRSTNLVEAILHATGHESSTGAEIDELRRQLQDARNTLFGLSSHDPTDALRAANLRDQLILSELRLEEVEQDIIASSVGRPMRAIGRIADTETVQRRLLDPGVALLSSFVFDGATYLVCITSSVVRSAVVTWSRDHLGNLVRMHNQTIANPAIAGRDVIAPGTPREQAPSQDAPGVQLAFRLFGPFEDMLGQDVRRLIVVPSGPLAQLAVETLPLDEARLVLDQLEVSYLPSVTFALLERSAPSKGHTLAVAVSRFPASGSGRAFSPLPGARREVERLANKECVLLLDEQATRANVLARFSGARYIHLATHGFADPEDELRSFIVLHPEDYVTASDLMRCKLDSELVVLSACRSGLSPGSPTEGVLGLPRALLLAGTRGLIVSLWAVDDEATAALFDTFYELLWSGVPPAEALWRAKQALRARAAEGHRFAAAGHWGAFVYIGPSTFDQARLV